MDTEIKHKYPRVKKYGPGIAVALVGIVVLGWAAVSMKDKTYSTDSRALTFGEVTMGEFNDYVRLNGRVETGVIVQVSALETGIVERKWVEEGTMVNAGDIILTLNNPNLRQQILDSESQLAEKQNMLRDTEIAMEKERLQIKQDLLNARTELNRKKREADRQRQLYAEKLTSREECLKAEEDYKLAKESLQLLIDRQRQDSLYRSVQVAMMKESLHNMQENFMLVRQRADNLNIRATHGGQLGSLTAELGQNIASGQQVGQINILDNYKLSVNIDEHYIDRIVQGLTGKAQKQNVSFDVVVKKVYPEVNNGQFKADLTIESNMPKNIRVGQTFPIDLQLGEPTTAVMVERGSYFQSTGGHWVYVVDEDGKTAWKREIKTGRQNPLYYEVTEGLEPGKEL